MRFFSTASVFAPEIGWRQIHARMVDWKQRCAIQRAIYRGVQLTPCNICRQSQNDRPYCGVPGRRDYFNVVPLVLSVFCGEGKTVKEAKWRAGLLNVQPVSAACFSPRWVFTSAAPGTPVFVAACAQLTCRLLGFGCSSAKAGSGAPSRCAASLQVRSHFSAQLAVEPIYERLNIPGGSS